MLDLDAIERRASDKDGVTLEDVADLLNECRVLRKRTEPLDTTKIVDFIRLKAISDESMATVLRMIQENPDRVEVCILLAFEALYSVNIELQEQLARNIAQGQRGVISIVPR